LSGRVGEDASEGLSFSCFKVGWLLDVGGAIAAICGGLVSDLSAVQGDRTLLTLAKDGFETVMFVFCVAMVHTEGMKDPELEPYCAEPK